MEQTPTFDVVDSDDMTSKLKLQFIENLNQLRNRGKTSQLWLQYFELISIAMHFVQAERMGDWDLHLNCIKAMLPVFHASGHFLYAKSCQLYLQDMIALQDEMTENEYENFTKNSFFTIRRSEKH